jgi:SAM-dependent methyltransferase
MGLHRIVRRYQQLGFAATADYLRRRIDNSVIALVNRVGPARYLCPCCGWRGARFLDFAGHGYGLSNCSCPRCGSHPRHRGLFLFLGKLLSELAPGAAVLHLAPEGSVGRAFTTRRDLVYVTGDLTMRSAAARLDVNRLPFREGAFDLLLSSHMLEHLPSDGAALREMARVVKRGGVAVILVPTWQDWESRPTEEFGAPNRLLDNHYRQYGSDVVARIEASGMRCEPQRFSSFLSEARMRQCRIEEDTVFLARKP